MSVAINENTSDHTAWRARQKPRGLKAWAWTGVLAGIAGIVGIQSSLTLDAVYADRYVGDAEAITQRMSELVPNLLVFHVATMLATVLVLVFAVGLRRRLAAQAPAGSLLPDLSAAGMFLVSVAGLMGSALDTEFIFAAQDTDKVVAESVAFYAHWTGTVSFLWVGAGVTGVVLAVAALRHSAAPRWIGWVGAVVGGLTLLLGISPLQYMAGFTGPVMLLVVAAGFALGDRERSADGSLSGTRHASPRTPRT